MESKTHISVQNLSVYFDELRVLKDVSVDIPDHKITVIIGPSGCGKTTLLKSLNRLLDPLDGVRIAHVGDDSQYLAASRSLDLADGRP